MLVKYNLQTRTKTRINNSAFRYTIVCQFNYHIYIRGKAYDFHKQSQSAACNQGAITRAIIKTTAF